MSGLLNREGLETLINQIQSENLRTEIISNYNAQPNPQFFFKIRKNTKHWILEDVNLDNVKFGEQGKGVYPVGADVICASESNFNPTTCLLTGGNVYLSANNYGKGRAVYISSLTDSYDAFRLVYKTILWVASKEDLYKKCLSLDPRTDLFYYKEKDCYAIINNCCSEIITSYFDKGGNEFNITLKPNEIVWIK